MIHMTCAYWGFVLMSLHLGIHWGMMMGMARKVFPKSSSARTWILRLAGIAIAVYGLYAFVKRDILSYLLMQVQYVFFDFEEPVIFFILDYMATMGVLVFIGYYLWKGLTAKRSGRKTK